MKEFEKLIQKWEADAEIFLSKAPIYKSFIDEAKEALEREKAQVLPINSANMADKALMINALTNTLMVNKKDLGNYSKVEIQSFSKLIKVIESIDI
jgi:hypothetical protein